MNQKDYEDFSEGLNLGYLFLGIGSLILFLVSQIYHVPVLPFLSLTTFFASIYFVPPFNETRKKARYEKTSEKSKRMLIARGIGIGFIAILTFCYFHLVYSKNLLHNIFHFAFLSLI